ncbi:MAG: tetratricopeptide repeat protein, partial [Saprospiraceae bacterium]|nr:tetratricopeptide repeat protein [Saprospiraceae bacterium]
MKKIYGIGVLFLFALVIGCKSDKTSKAGQSETDDTLSEINKLIMIDTSDHKLLFQRAQYYYDLENYDAAIQDLKKAIEMEANEAPYYHLLSDCYLDYYKSKEALQTMEKAGDLFPERIMTQLKLSETQHILKQYEASLFTIAKVLTMDDQNAEAYFMMGLNFRAMNEIDRAKNAFQTATELNPELLDAWLILGKLYENDNDPMALQYYDAAININPELPSTWHAKAFFLQNNNRIPEAIDIYKQISQIDKYYLDAYLNSGILYMELDSFEQAYTQFDIMAQLKSQNFISYYY